MRITLFLFVLGVFQAYAVDSYAQNTQLTINESNIELGELFNRIENQTDFYFFYSNDQINKNQKVSVDVSNKTIFEILDVVLKDTDITYMVSNKAIILNTLDKAESIAQQPSKRQIAGRVTDEFGEPIIGANVVITGTAIGTSTDVNGRFSLEVEERGSINISYIGYLSQTIQVSGRTNFNITLEEDTQDLEELVVVGYNTVRKADLTTSVSIVSTEDISERPIVSPVQALQGKAAGVQVIKYSGEPGGGLSVRVRGSTSIQAGNEPLYVVDGMPTSSISDLNANDIESMQVLKDASASAIYGARAANGVVVITTKRGVVNKRNITLNMYTGISQLGNKIKALNTEEYKDYIKDLNKYASAPVLIPDEETRYTDWSDEFFGTGYNHNYQLSLSNGTENTRYYLSLGYIGEQGIVEKAHYDRYNFRANLDNKLMDWLDIALNLGYSLSEGSWVRQNSSSMRSGSILSVINTPPYMQIWDENNPEQYDEFGYGSRILHPIAANAADNSSKTSSLTSSIDLNFSVTKNLKYKLKFGYDESNTKSDYYMSPVLTSDGRATKGSASEGFSRYSEWLLENIVTYENSFNDTHNLSLLGGNTLQKAYSEGGDMGGYDMFRDFRYVSGANIIDKDGVNTWASEWALASFLGRVSYDYKRRYLLSANIRADGSSKFTPGHKWGVFPSVSGAWRISDESFMESLSDVVSDFKIRGGWGLTGNQGGIGDYAWMARYSMSRIEPTTEVPFPGFAITQQTPGNRELTWESTSQYNVGIDLALFNSRVVMTLDAYYKYTRDMLLTVWLPSTANVPGGVQRNDGEMKNAGLELDISTKNFVSEFKWDTDFNISFNKNKLVKMGLTPVSRWATTYTTNQPAIILRDGLALGSFYGYIAEGVDPETGDVVYKDLNENGFIDPEDRTIIGNAQPDFIFGLTNSFSYKNFYLSIFFQGSYGNEIFNSSKIDMTSMMDFRNQSVDVLNRWKRPGMETDIPRPGNIDNVNNSTRFVEDGSYIRLKNITLSYNFDTNRGFFRKIGITSLQPYITGQNLLTFTKYSGYDPEVNAYGRHAIEQGVDYGTYPQSKSVIFGLNLQF